VVTGGVVDIGPRWWDPMEATFRHEVIGVLSEIPMVRGTLGADAPLRGAATSVWKSLEGKTK
jgi:glucokinase